MITLNAAGRTAAEPASSRDVYWTRRRTRSVPVLLEHARSATSNGESDALIDERGANHFINTMYTDDQHQRLPFSP